MKSVKMAGVHPAALQLFQKPVESTLDSGSERRTVGEGEGEEERRDTHMVSGEGGEMAMVVHWGKPVPLQGLEWSGERGGPADLCCGTEGPEMLC